MNALITFETDTNFHFVVQELERLGYQDSWNTNNGKKKYGLPVGTLWQQQKELESAYEDVKKAVKNVNKANGPTKLMRCICVAASPFIGLESQSLREQVKSEATVTDSSHIHAIPSKGVKVVHRFENA